MRSVVPPEFMASQPKSLFASPLMGKCMYLCRSTMERMSSRLKQTVTLCSESACELLQADRTANDGFDWRLHELSHAQQSLPARTWKRLQTWQSAGLTGSASKKA